jgi:hypothetical protein
MSVKKKAAMIIAAALFAIWWMQAKGYEKGRARIIAENEACFDRHEKGDTDGTFSRSNQMYCDFIYRPSDMDSLPARLYEFLVR